MACTSIATIFEEPASGVKFGIQEETAPEAQFGSYIQNVKLTAKADKQEIRGSCGTVKAVVFSKRALDIEYTHFGLPKAAESIGGGATIVPFGIGSSFTEAANDFIEGITTVYLEEVTTEQSNTEATKTTVKAVAYAGNDS
jgi:hypothetical protein